MRLVGNYLEDRELYAPGLRGASNCSGFHIHGIRTECFPQPRFLRGIGDRRKTNQDAFTAVEHRAASIARIDDSLRTY